MCEDNDIRLATSVAKDEHISNGNELGTIDRLVRTLRELIENDYDRTGYSTDNTKNLIKSIIDTYNNTSHRTLNYIRLIRYLVTIMTKWPDI